MFSDCSGPCETCRIHYLGGCLAGHGDDDYSEATPEWIETIGKAAYERHQEWMKNWLKKWRDIEDQKIERVKQQTEKVDLYIRNLKHA